MLRGGHVALVVGDVGTAVRFYVESLGLKLVEEREGRAIVDAGDGFRIALSTTGARGPRESGAGITLYPKLPLDEALAIFENRGIDFVVETDGAFRRAAFRDPDGNALAFEEPSSG
jgi:catechol 2,3-dioxygenase-like lactoylglutathione lyase family enzyme